MTDWRAARSVAVVLVLYSLLSTMWTLGFTRQLLSHCNTQADPQYLILRHEVSVSTKHQNTRPFFISCNCFLMISGRKNKVFLRKRIITTTTTTVKKKKLLISMSLLAAEPENKEKYKVRVSSTSIRHKCWLLQLLCSILCILCLLSSYCYLLQSSSDHAGEIEKYSRFTRLHLVCLSPM